VPFYKEKTLETKERIYPLKYRALAVKFAEEYLWFWIGEHNIYEVLIR